MQAGLLTNPVFALLFPVGPKKLGFAATQTLEALWLRSRRVVAVEDDCERAATNQVECSLDLAHTVRAAFWRRIFRAGWAVS